MRRDIKTDWTVRDDVRAKIWSSIKRLLVKHKYPPDKQPEAIKLVIEQREAMAPRYASRGEAVSLARFVNTRPVAHSSCDPEDPMTFLLADETWTIAQAVAVCDWYAKAHPDTLAYYDFAGACTAPHPHDTVDLSDAGRLVVINARLTADDVPTMIAAAAEAPWGLVDWEEDLITAPDPEDLLGRAEKLYDHFRYFRERGLGPTRTHKLLHLKRPAVYPIVDSVVRRTYKRHAERAAEVRGRGGTHYWLALAEELRVNGEVFAALREALGDQRIGQLSTPRLFDILIWSLHGREAAQVRQLPGVRSA
jgi:hypothetical protein